MIAKIIFIFLFKAYFATASDQSLKCPKSELLSDHNNESILGCDAAVIALKLDSAGDKAYRNKINKNLAEIVAKQATQVLQTLGSSSAYFENNNKSFLVKDSPEVATQCKFDFISKLETEGCPGKSDKADQKNRIKILKDAFDTQNSSGTLFETIADVYQTEKYGASPDQKTCPLNKSAYPLNSQLTPEVLQKFKSLLNPDIGNLSKMYEMYPQLSLIIEADQVSPTSKFKERFENYMKAFKDEKNSDINKYFSDFLFKNENQKIIGKGVAHRCSQANSSISRFICEPINPLATNNPEVSYNLFNKYDLDLEYQDQDPDAKQDKDFTYKTYAYQCLAKKQPEVSRKSHPSHAQASSLSIFDPCIDFKDQGQSVDNLYSCFNQNVHPDIADTKQVTLVENFCARYTCQSPDVQNAPSCKSGGPLSSDNLILLAENNPDIQNEISYLKSLELQRKTQKETKTKIQQSLASNSSSKDKNSSSPDLGMSAFDMNAFGSKSAMKFQNIPETADTTKLVENDMKAKGITPSTTEDTRRIASGEPVVQRPALATAPMPQAPQQASQVTNRALASTATSTYTYGDATAIAAKADRAHADASATSGKVDKVAQMVDDLNKIMKPNNNSARSIIPNAPTFAAEARPTSIDAESKKAKEEARELENWAQSLRNRERDLQDREFYADRRESERRQREMLRAGSAGDSPKSTADTGANASANSNANPRAPREESASSSGLKINQKITAADVNASPSGILVTPEKLDKLDKMDLKHFGVNIEEPFIISLQMNGKLIHVRVAKVTLNGSTFLAPRLNEDNKEVKEVILKSPMFSEFRHYYEKQNLGTMTALLK